MSLSDFIEPSQALTDVQSAQLSQEADDTGVSIEEGQLSLPDEADNGMFLLQHVQFQQFQFPSSLIDLKVSNNIMFIAFATTLLRIDLDDPLDIPEFPIKLDKADRIIRIFPDSTAKQLVVTTQQGKNYHVYETESKTGSAGALYTVKRLLKSKGSQRMAFKNVEKGVLITTVAWHGHSGSNNRQVFFAGTRDGEIYEARPEGLVQVYALDQATPITGLYMELFPSIVPSQLMQLAIITTPTRLYRFLSRREIQTDGTARNPFAEDPEIQELPGDQEYRDSHFFTQTKSFAWLTGDGIYYGQIKLENSATNGNIVDNNMLLSYPALFSEQQTIHMPLSVAVSKFHVILLYNDRLCVICWLTGNVVCEKKIPLRRGENVRGLAVDNNFEATTYWVTTSLAIHELVIKDEDRDVWQFYLDKRQYDTALQYCKTLEQKDKVYTAQAVDHFDQRRYRQSAECYAKTSVSFEKVALSFMQKRERDALRIYMLHKLESLPSHLYQQRTILATWLVEMYLAKINHLESHSSLNYMSTSWSMEELLPKHYGDQKHCFKDEFTEFIKSNQKYLHKPTVYQLIYSHGLRSEMLHYAEMIGDYDQVLEYQLREQNWDAVLKLLSDSDDNELLYKFSPLLMEHAPSNTVDVWIQKPDLNPRLLIPALLRYDHSKIPNKMTQNQAVRYLSHVIFTLRNTDTVIHNFLLSLHASQPTQDESALLAFLNNEDRETHYNLDYALRICSQYERTQSCIHIYSEMGLYEEAVDLALKHHDIDLALTHADKPLGDDGLRKKLWLCVEKYVIQDKGDIKAAMGLLRKCDLLKIKDILPFFPEFVLIDDFKDEICTALKEYNIHIDELKADMDEATKSADAIRLDIRKLRFRFAEVKITENCCHCHYPLLTRQFYVFPCDHKYHADCLINKTTKHLPTWQIRRLANLQERLSRELSESASISRSSRLFQPDTTDFENAQLARMERTDRLKEELDDIVARECVLCGDIMIKSINRPFIGEEEARLVDSWTLE